MRHTMRRTKIVCTIGPATDSPEMLRALVRAGMDVARLNFSHGSYEEHAKRVERIRELAESCGRQVAILQDLPGQKIRIGEMAAPVILEPGQSFTFTSANVPGDRERASIPHRDLFGQVRKGMSVFLDDAKLELKVTSADKNEIRTRVVNGGELGSRR